MRWNFATCSDELKLSCLFPPETFLSGFRTVLIATKDDSSVTGGLVLILTGSAVETTIISQYWLRIFVLTSSGLLLADVFA